MCCRTRTPACLVNLLEQCLLCPKLVFQPVQGGEHVCFVIYVTAMARHGSAGNPRLSEDQLQAVVVFLATVKNNDDWGIVVPALNDIDVHSIETLNGKPTRCLDDKCQLWCCRIHVHAP